MSDIERCATVCDEIANRYARMVEPLLIDNPCAARRYATYCVAAEQCASEIRELAKEKNIGIVTGVNPCDQEQSE